jgi:hypothetical protein
MDETCFPLACHAFDAAGELVDRYGYSLSQAGYSLTASGPNGVCWEQSRTPTWAVILAVVLFPIGMLFLLTKDERSVTMQVVPAAQGCEVRVAIRGKVPKDLLSDQTDSASYEADALPIGETVVPVRA